jgi:predicted short-subunit dehydrogenase-like oxidoreductase (DUF2520 family)
MRIVLLGAGNLATQLAKALKINHIDIIQIYSHTHQSAKILADQIGCAYTHNLAKINPNADMYIYALKDNALTNVINKTGRFEAIHAHTAGSVDMNIFRGKANKFGVFYPLQTFSKTKDISFEAIPIFIEASTNDVQESLAQLATLLNCKHHIINSEQRSKLHLAAVFACNFSNLMYGLAADIVSDAELDFDILKPLINETASKINYLSPLEAQTGPATRFDVDIIEKHKSQLADQPELTDIYDNLSKLIYSRTKKIIRIKKIDASD